MFKAIGGIIVVLIALPSIWFSREYRQAELDRGFIAAIRTSDRHAFDTLLAEGANSNSHGEFGRGTALGYAVVAGNVYQVMLLQMSAIFTVVIAYIVIQPRRSVGFARVRGF